MVHPKFFFFYIFFIFSFLFFGNVNFASASYERYAVGDTVTIGEFVYDDNYVATTTAVCVVDIYDASSTHVVSNIAMTPASNGWYSYNLNIPLAGPEGVWPAQITCGSEIGGDLVKEDKTFVVAPKLATKNDITEASTSIVSAVNANTNTIVENASSSLASGLPKLIWEYSSRTLSDFGTLVASTTEAVWSASTRTLSGFGTLVASTTESVWGAGIRTLTSAGLLSGSLATKSDIDTATSTIIENINSNLNTQLNNATSTIIANVNSNTNNQLNIATTTIISSINSSGGNNFTVTLSDFGQTMGGQAYRAKLQILDKNSIPTDASSTPVLTIYDSNRTEKITAGAMTRDSAGTYHYNYTVDALASSGVWETEASVELGAGNIIKVNDYWEVEGSPAQVKINDITDKIIPEITANFTITNEGTKWYEYHYEWCVVTSTDNACGGNDDVFHGTGSKRIEVGDDFVDNLTATVPTAGNYYFKLVVYYGTERSGASRSFTAVASSVTPPAGGGGGSGGSGGGGGGAGSPSVPSVPTGVCRKADFNCDTKVNSVDFSILLYYWKAKSPFKNQYVDINKDNKIDSVDFSILLYEWDKK